MAKMIMNRNAVPLAQETDGTKVWFMRGMIRLW